MSSGGLGNYLIGGGIAGGLMDALSGGEPASGQLGNLGIHPQFYDPNSFSAPTLTGGSYNRMAERLAGPVYDPVAGRGARYPDPKEMAAAMERYRSVIPRGARKVAP